MGRKKPKNKGEGSKPQQEEQAPPEQPQPSSSASEANPQPARAKGGKGKKQQAEQPSKPVPSEQPQKKQQPQPSSPASEANPQPTAQPSKHVPQKHQQQQQPQGVWQQRQQVQQQAQRPTELPVQGVSQQRGPIQQGRGQGRGQPQQSGPGLRQESPPQQPGTPHSASPSPQPGQGVRAQTPRHVQQAQAVAQPGAPPGLHQQYSQPHHAQQYQQPGAPQQRQQPPQQYQQLPQQLQQMQVQPGGPQQRAQPPPGFQQQYPQQAAGGPPIKRPGQQQGQQQRPQQAPVSSPSQQQPGPPQGAWQKHPQQQQSQPQPSLPSEAPTRPVGQQPSRRPQQGQQGDHGPQGAAAPPPQQEVRRPQGSSPPLDLAIPRRKKLNSAGTAGRKILIETNHLALTLKKLESAIHYDVVIVPDTPKKLLRPVMEAFRRANYPARYPAFDGSRNLYCSPPYLPFQEYISREVTIEENERPKTFKVTIKFAAMVDLSVLSRYFEANIRTADAGTISAGEGNRHMITPQEAIQCLDVVLRSAPALHCIPVGRSFFTKPRDQIINLGDGMEMYYGFYQSAILGWKPFLNVDVAHKAFPKSQNIIDLIKEMCPRVDLAGKLTGSDFETVDKFLRMLKVQYEIPTNPTSRRVMRINQLDRSAKDARFKTDDNQEMTVADYFTNVKGYSLRYPNMPCLWVGSRNRDSKILFPPELCTLMEGQVTNRAMTPGQTTEMIRVAATSTGVRKDKILSSIRAAQFNRDPSAQEFGISVSQDFARVPARVLESPYLRYKDESVKPQRGTWRAKIFRNGKSLSKWCIVCVDERTRPPALHEFAEMMIQQGKPLGMAIAKPNPIIPMRLSYRREKAELEQQFSKLKDMELILVVINENKDTYNFVKQAAELTAGTLTQCVRGKNVFRPKPATVGNILLKVNAKLNGVNHCLAQRPRLLDRPCMIMGADVTHPSPESRGTVPSVAAVTASHDPSAFQYNICWRLQPPTQEIISDLANIVKEHLLFFYMKNNKIKPESIIFFRDGVSEGQFQTVLNAEVQTIRQACTMLQEDGLYRPKITFLVVQKRHHTRFFPTNPKDSEDRNMNVPAGTIVDTEITHPTALDFYLVSHASIQGVARPTKYRMLWDDNNMNEDELEQLTYHLCHMFTRCTRSVSYPAPTYYAHLAAARAKVYCERRQLNMDDLGREQEQLVIKPEVIKSLPMFFV